MKKEPLMVISVKKRNNDLTWTYEMFILCGKSKLCFAYAPKKANDGTLAVCSKLLDTWSLGFYKWLSGFWFSQ